MISLLSDIMIKTCCYVSIKLYEVGYYLVYKEPQMSKTEQLLVLQSIRIKEMNNELIEIHKLLKK